MTEKLAQIARSCEEEYLAAIYKPDSTHQRRTELRLKWEAACQAMVEFKTKLKKVDNGEAV